MRAEEYVSKAQTPFFTGPKSTLMEDALMNGDKSRHNPSGFLSMRFKRRNHEQAKRSLRYFTILAAKCCVAISQRSTDTRWDYTR
jgi:hypothetical protein